MKLSGLLGALTLLTTGLILAVPAQAALNDCATDRTCMWDDNDYSGPRTGRDHGKEDIVNVVAERDNKMDSYANRSATYQTCAFSGQNGLGDEQDWEELEKNSDVSPLNSDEVSSWRTKFGC